ncbi:hypothetical protein NRB36_004311 [Salmonella enterica]|nr:hypothetical protein [Salmonella enterica]EJO1639670.1 hypothetical protein [Salmonella enterica]
MKRLTIAALALVAVSAHADSGKRAYEKNNDTIAEFCQANGGRDGCAMFIQAQVSHAALMGAKAAFCKAQPGSASAADCEEAQGFTQQALTNGAVMTGAN